MLCVSVRDKVSPTCMCYVDAGESAERYLSIGRVTGERCAVIVNSNWNQAKANPHRNHPVRRVFVSCGGYSCTDTQVHAGVILRGRAHEMDGFLRRATR